MDSTDEIPENSDEEFEMECRKAAKEQHLASSQQMKSETISHASQREMAAQSVLRDGLASTIEEARKLVDEAI